MGAGRHGSGTVAETLHPDLQAGDRERHETGLGVDF